MGYYLSPKNEKIVLPILLDLASRKSDRFIKSENPETLEYIIRSAFNTRYKELKEKFSLHVKKDGVLCKWKSVSFSVLIDEEESKSASLFDIMNVLIGEKPNEISFSPYVLNDDDEMKLAIWCEKNHYSYTKTTTEISFNHD